MGKNTRRPGDNQLKRQMAMSKPVTVLCDSRGFGLQEIMDNTSPHRFTLKSVSSAGLVMAVTNFLSELIKDEPEYVIIAAGICEVTLKNNTTKKYSIRYTDPDESVRSYLEAMNEAKGLLQDVLPDTKVIFNPVTGVDLEDYNTKARNGLTGEDLREYHDNKPVHPMQEVLNTSVVAINREISRFNHSNKIATPWSASLVHKHEKGSKYYHHYQYLSDGCHLLDECKKYWAYKFQSAITKSIEIYNN